MGGRDCCAPVTGRLRALVDGELDTAEQGAVLGHLEGCPNCRRAHRRIQEVVQLTQSVRTEEPPDHFTAALQVRLGREREARRRKLAGPGGWLRLPTPGWDSRRPWAARLAAVGLVAGGLAVGLSRPLNANEIVRRAELSWRQIRNYGCVFRSEGWYLGQHRVFRQRQFFRRPGEFRLDTSQDYPLSTFVSDHQLVHYLPGGDWQGNGPLVLIRPRRPGDDGLPFPFGRNWGRSGNINLDLVVRWMYQDQEPRLVGTEKVGDLECYHLQLTPGADGSGSRDQHDVWIDRVSFLPRRVSWRRDDQNWIVTEATELQVNYQVLPQGTFDFQIPDGACVIQGDVDPHVFALPFPAPDSGAEGLDPVSRTWNEVTRRAGNLRFPVLSPEWLPEGLQLVRVRRRTGRWLDVHWLRNGGQGVRHVLKLVEQEVSADSYPGQRVRV
ncbi:MAG: hypothetical protein FJX77_05280, partial [Armatimonadetes bacterium]|nr:hypothetical protein [Armatimonadota bacterium]